jgi:hypothetical protein
VATLAKHIFNIEREILIIVQGTNSNTYHIKVHESYSLSKDALREEGTPMLIKFSNYVFLDDVIYGTL